jgi:hypothetical protein
VRQGHIAPSAVPWRKTIIAGRSQEGGGPRSFLTDGRNGRGGVTCSPSGLGCSGAHSRIVIALSAVTITAGPLVAATAAHAAYDTALRTERRQAATRHPVEATVLSTTSNAFRFGADQKTAVQWREPTGLLRSGQVPLRGGDEPGLRRTIWIDQAGRTTSRPTPHTHTVIDAIATSATSVSALCLVLALTYLMLERRLDRRRSASWEKEWIGIAPRWTGRSGRQD